MKVDLDRSSHVSRLDRSNMLGAVDRFPDPFLARKEIELSFDRRPEFRSLVMMGMGGSASAGDVVLDWLGSHLGFPAVVHREPQLPAFVSRRTLFIAISHSGETSETLAAFRAARKRGAHLIGVGSGGRLSDLCAQYRAPFICVEPAPAPRAALSQLIVATSAALENLGLVKSTSRGLMVAGKDLVKLRGRLAVGVRSERNAAKLLASKLLGNVVVLYSLQRISSVVRRFKNQLAENSKEFAKYDGLPEACHNEIESWQSPAARALPVIIRDSEESRFERSIIEAFRSTIRSSVGRDPIDIQVGGQSRLSRLLCPILFLDYVSVYLAFLKGIDPTPTWRIAEYKRRLKNLT